MRTRSFKTQCVRLKICDHAFQCFGVAMGLGMFVFHIGQTVPAQAYALRADPLKRRSMRPNS